MFTNKTNIVEQLKFKKKNLIRLLYAGIFVLWAFGYFLIKKVEASKTEANVYFVLELAFAIISFVTAFFIPNDRDKTLDFFKYGTAGFALYTVLFEVIMIAANAGGGQSNTVQVLRSVCGYSRAIIPLGLILWQAKKWTFLTGINKNKKKTIEHLKNHGNDGMN